MKVSVVLPVYNGEQTLVKTLDSLVGQSFQDFELLVCIDGGTDGSKTILNAYKGNFKNLRILENTINRGLGPTMNRLIHEAKGEYIAVAEQDDYYYPNRLEVEVAALNANDHVGMVSGIAEFWDGEQVSTKFPGILVHGGAYPEGKDMFLYTYLHQIKVVNSCMMFRKSVHVANGLYFTQHFPSISVDWTYVLRFSLVSTIFGLHEVLVRMDRRPTRNSVTKDKNQQFLAARELIRSMAYEFPNLISKENYRYALNTQRLLELGTKRKIDFLFFCLFNWAKTFDIRYPRKLKKRIFKDYFSF